MMMSSNYTSTAGGGVLMVNETKFSLQVSRRRKYLQLPRVQVGLHWTPLCVSVAARTGRSLGTHDSLLTTVLSRRRTVSNPMQPISPIRLQ